MPLSRIVATLRDYGHQRRVVDDERHWRLLALQVGDFGVDSRAKTSD